MSEMTPDALHVAATRALACLDLTSLNDADTEADVVKLCARAQGPHGPVAAVCVWPRFAALARRELPAGIAVAAVANFPDGSADSARAVRDARAIVDAGAQEVDVVLPFAALQRGDERAVAELLAAVRAACSTLVLKVILETGVLADEALIARASQLSLAAGADFLKTSTGKTPVSATPAAARTMLAAIAADPRGAARVGFKASGGIRTVADAAVYLALCEQALGADALTPRRFRIGASSLLNDIEAVLGGRAAPPAAPAGAVPPPPPAGTY
ncbi:MAG TPA: deoxyribose-phosphate aldolase [Burkholderiaceae bacterium]|nr:deoxyribose-phosphate aldolase [Burkholderiaceae bacterium]